MWSSVRHGSARFVDRRNVRVSQSVRVDEYVSRFLNRHTEWGGASPWYPSDHQVHVVLLAGNQFFFPLVSFPKSSAPLSISWESVLLPPGILPRACRQVDNRLGISSSSPWYPSG